MTRTRLIFRIIFCLLTVFLIVFINKKTNDNTETIVEFKLKMIDKLRTDSLDNKHKVDQLIEGTTKFIEGSSHVRKGIHYLAGLLTLWGAIELGFLIIDRRNYGGHEFKK